MIVDNLSMKGLHILQSLEMAIFRHVPDNRTNSYDRGFPQTTIAVI
jgi:hypothetical protein